jgi:3-hydroxyisobutyrate dehydrogenase
MSRRLVDAGHTVIGYDVSVQARQRAAAFGVLETGQLEEVATGAELVILILPNSDVVESVLTDEALLNRLEPGTLVVDMSSSEPLRTRALAESLHTRAIRMIDAPVSGGVTGAEKGSLTVMVGGATTDLAIARSCLETFGRVIHAGSIGAGHAVKALNNLLSATHLWITSEAMLVGERFGVDAEVMLAVFNSSSGRSGSTENKWPNFILPGTFNSGFGLRLMVKDMGIAVQLAEEVGVPSVLGSEALELWSRAAQNTPPTADHTEIVRWLEAEARPDGH